MSCCARCGQSICSTAGKIALNKVWHKNCFCCYSCNRPLHVTNAKVYYGEVFCSCCCPQESCPLKICRVSSTPSINPDCPQRMIKPVCCNSSSSVYYHPRDVHSCSCIPSCCNRGPTSCNCSDCCEEQSCYKRAHCTPKSPKPCNYPPRQRPPRFCPCQKCRPCSPKRKICGDPCYPIIVKRKIPCDNSTKMCPTPPCYERRKKMIYFQPCVEKQPPCNNYCCKYCNSDRCKTERCKRCGEKVFAAEKILTSHGAYHLGCFSCYCCCRSLCVKTMFEACGEIYCRQCYNNYFGISGYGYCC